jgi:hypothetical protein
MNETTNENKAKAGVGMPQQLYLHEFGSKIWETFGHIAYLVGSVLTSKSWRDVDIRLMLDDPEFDRLFPNVKSEADTHLDGAWVGYCLAWSALGEKMTGLPIDFQIQRTEEANRRYPGLRSAIGITPLRVCRSRET